MARPAVRMPLPPVGLGTWKAPPGQVGAAVKAALKAGYKLVDCAEAYDNQDEVGLALEQAFADGVAVRDEVTVVSKVFNHNHGERAEASLKKTMQDLRVGVDLWLMHWPIRFENEELPSPPRGPTGWPNPLIQASIEYKETWRVMERLYNEGLCGGIGVCNFTRTQLEDLLASCTVRPLVNQVEAHPFLVDAELHEFCAKEGIQVMAYSPLGSADSYSGKLVGPILLEDPEVNAVAKAAGISAAQALLSWGMRDGACVLAKSVREERIIENLKSVDIKLDAPLLDRLTHLDRNYRLGLGWMRGHFWDDAAWEAGAKHHAG